MGRGNKKKNRGGRHGGNRNGNWNQDTRGDRFEVEKRNEKFEHYYNELGLIPDTEQDEFWTSMRKELPNSWRFTGSKGHALAVQQRLIDQYIPNISSVTYDGNFVEPPKQVEWFPEKLAWSMNTPKNVIRKFPPFASFQKFLVSETSVGNISRQEVVSMIPPLLMDVRPGMTVLDVCAAPGSKSAQLIEMVHGGEETRIRKVLQLIEKKTGSNGNSDEADFRLELSQAENDGNGSDHGRATGLLVANDVDGKRAHLLVHQVKRLNSPNLIVTNHDAQHFPSIRIPSDGIQAKYLKFDRILADVPCTGDGTARKNVNVWKDWTPINAIGLHPMQSRILIRALQMLKVGGRVVYSTCSLNPVENEAVITTAIERCGGNSKVRIVDCREELPGLKRSCGLTSWKVMDKSGKLWSSWSDVEAARINPTGDVNVESIAKLSDTLFAPPPAESEEERIPLEHCIRVYPHFQNTGGFFITVLEKLSEIKSRPEDIKRPRFKPEQKSDATNGALESDKNGTGHQLQSNFDVPAMMATTEDENPDLVRAEGFQLKHQRDDEDRLEAPTKKLKTDEQPQEGTMDISVESNGTESVRYDGATTANGHTASSSTNLEGATQSIAKQEPTTSAEADPSFLMNTKSRANQSKEEPYKYLRPDHPELLHIFEFYQLSTRFPRDRFMVRNATGEPVKAIYYTSELARDILTMNEGKGLKFVQCGVKMFMKQDSQGKDICRWRIQVEGMPILEPWVGEDRVVRLYKQPTFKKLLIEMFPKVGGGGWVDLGEIGERVRDISMGCCILRVDKSDDGDGFVEDIVLPLWRSVSSVNLMLPKEDRKAMLLRLFNDDSPLIDHNQQRKITKAQNIAQERGRALSSAEPQSEKSDDPQTADGAVIADATD